MRDTWGPPTSGWPSFCGDCGKRRCVCPPSLADIAEADAVVMPRGDALACTCFVDTLDPCPRHASPTDVATATESPREVARKAEHDRLVKSFPSLIRRHA